MGNTSAKSEYQSVVDRLLREEVSYATHSLWDRLWILPLTTADHYSLFSAADARHLCNSRPTNLSTLLLKAVEQLYAIGGEQSSAQQQSQRTLNSLRLLTRILPIVHEHSSLSQRLFWSDLTPATLESETGTASASSSFADSDLESSSEAEESFQTIVAVSLSPTRSRQTSERSASRSASEESLSSRSGSLDLDTIERGSSPSAPASAVQQLLGSRLLDGILRLLFMPGFTCAAATASDPSNHSSFTDRVWASGVSDNSGKDRPSRDMISNRREVLLCLLAAVSSSVYARAGSRNQWLQQLVISRRKQVLKQAMFYSLLNTALSYDPVGWGLPYNHYLFSDTYEGLSTTCLQVLMVLLSYDEQYSLDVASYHSRRRRHRLPATDEEQPEREPETGNLFNEFLSALIGQAEFEFISASMCRLLAIPLLATRTYLPGSTKSVASHQELLILLWHCVRANEPLLKYMLRTRATLKLLTPILAFFLQSRHATTQDKLGLAHLGAFLMMVFSGQREFGISLAEPYAGPPLPDIGFFAGTYADLVLLAIHKVLVDGHPKLIPLHECLLTVLTNISPYIKNLNPASCLNLLKLLERYSKDKFLFANERNHRNVFFLLESFNNMIQYQYDGNERLVYELIRHREAFDRLGKLRNQAIENLQSQVIQHPVAASAAAKPDQGPSSPRTHGDTTAAAPAPPHTPGHYLASGQRPMPTGTDTQAWIDHWASILPVTPVLRLIGILLPELSSVYTGTALDITVMMDLIRNTTLVGLMPVPHPILIRCYQENEVTRRWLSAYLWRVIYLRNEDPPLLRHTRVKLFPPVRESEKEAAQTAAAALQHTSDVSTADQPDAKQTNHLLQPDSAEKQQVEQPDSSQTDNQLEQQEEKNPVESQTPKSTE